MSFTARLRATGQLFWAAVDADAFRDVHELEDCKRSSGHLFEALLTEPDRVVYTEARWATFVAQELEDWPGDIRLVHIRG